jgi:hypothetical protein
LHDFDRAAKHLKKSDLVMRKMYFFLTLEKVVYVLNEDMLFALASSSLGTKDQTVTNNGEKFMPTKKDKDQIDHMAAKIKAQEL